MPAKEVARNARRAGDTAWWVFVIGRLMAEFGGGTLPRRYADHVERPSPLQWGLLDTPSGVIAACALAALLVVLLAAVVEAAAVRRWPVGVFVILAPLAGAIVVLAAVHERAGSPFAGVQLNLVAVFALVLVGVAVRQAGRRAVAPNGIRGRS